MTKVAETYLGNIIRDRVLAQRLDRARESKQLLEVRLQESDRQKGRISTRTNSGVAVGIIKSRDFKLQEGDVFATRQGNLLLIHLAAETLMVLNFSAAVNLNSATQLVRLGHLLGNQHYPIKIESDKIYVRLTTDSSVITKAIEELNFAGLTISWEQVAEVTDMSQHSHHH